jgi:hypothetical protein
MKPLPLPLLYLCFPDKTFFVNKLVTKKKLRELTISDVPVCVYWDAPDRDFAGYPASLKAGYPMQA